MIRIIAALDSRRGIATDSGIPWNLPGDTAYFRAKTAAGLILMGRATYDEFAAPLHARDNFVLTAHPGPMRTGFRTIGSLDQLVAEHPGEDVWVIGGAAVYEATIAEAEELLLTQVDGDFRCTKFFPPYQSRFGLSSTSDDQQDGATTYRFETWRRLSSSPTDPARSHAPGRTGPTPHTSGFDGRHEAATGARLELVTDVQTGWEPGDAGLPRRGGATSMHDNSAVHVEGLQTDTGETR